MEKAWLFDSVAVTVAEIDFVDPADPTGPDARERGVRLEVRPLETRSAGSVYVSPTLVMQPAVCRIDLLESRPGAADRIHWHPTMVDGEPGTRVFDPALSQDPADWLSDALRHVDRLVEAAPTGGRLSAGEITAIAAATNSIVAAVDAARERAQEPWPEVTRDSRGIGREVPIAD